MGDRKLKAKLESKAGKLEDCQLPKTRHSINKPHPTHPQAGRCRPPSGAREERRLRKTMGKRRRKTRGWRRRLIVVVG